jgi:hypothetical protein
VFSDATVSAMSPLARRTLETGDAAICAGCVGRGVSGGRDCALCNGKGAVCPACRGMRFLRLRRKYHQPWESDLARCSVCCEGNNVNEALEMQAIRAYIARSDAVTRPTLVPREGE